MNKSYDAVVIGAGIIGASAAMQLACAGLRVLVVERAAGPGFGSTAKSSAQISQTYAYEDFSQLAFESLQIFRNWRDFVQLTDTKANFRQSGCLQLANAGNPAIEESLEMHRKIGIRSAFLDSAALRSDFPDISFASNPVDLTADDYEPEYQAVGILEQEAGFADPVGTVEDYLAAAEGQGAIIRYQASICAIGQTAGRVGGVTIALPNGVTEAVESPVVVNCAGPWAGTLNALAGASLEHRFESTRHQVVHKGFAEKLTGTVPLVRDRINNLYFRLEANGGEVHIGSTKPTDAAEVVADPDAYNEVADAPYRERQLMMLQHRLPALETRGQVTSYAGLYCHYTYDDNPVVTESSLPGFYMAVGLGGEGFKSSPVVGMMLARQITGQWGRGETNLPIGMYGLDRPSRNRKLWDRQPSPEVN